MAKNHNKGFCMRTRHFLSTLSLLFELFLASSILLGEARRTSSSSGKRCATCSMFEDYKQIRQQQILSELLKKLELTDKPNVTVDYDNLPPIGHNNSRVQALIDQTLSERRRRVRKSVGGRRGGFGVSNGEPRAGIDYFPALYETGIEETPQTSYVMAERDPAWIDREIGGESVLFTFSPVLQSKYIAKAVLNIMVYQEELFELSKVPITVNVFQRFENGSIGYMLATKADYISGRRHFVQIPLNPLDIQPWTLTDEDGRPLDEVENTLGLYIQVMDASGEILNQASSDPLRKPSMFIELESYDNNRSGRGRRALNLCRNNSNQTGCCLHDLVIDFEKVGWEFVIAPKRYNAYICSGECDPIQMSKSPMGRVAIHANVDHFLCCHPKEYTGITVVYVDEGDQIWIREVPSMVARKCGCT